MLIVILILIEISINRMRFYSALMFLLVSPFSGSAMVRPIFQPKWILSG